MTSTRFNSLLVVSIACGVCVSTAWGDGQIPDRATLDSLLGGGQTLEDFESFAVGDGAATSLDVAMLDDSTITNGQGPGLVEAGATYVASTNVLQWNGHNYFGLPTRTFLANGERLEITYDPPVTAMGFDVHAFSGFGYSGTMTVFDLNNTNVGVANFTLNSGGTETVFIGWEHSAGISRIVLDDLAHSWSPVINDHGYGSGGALYRLRVTGSCPGRLTIAWSDATPGAQQGLVFGNNLGSTRIPNAFPCAGTQLGLQGGVQLVDPPGYFGTGSGQGSFNGNAGAAACGHYLQLVEGGSCQTSNVAQIP